MIVLWIFHRLIIEFFWRHQDVSINPGSACVQKRVIPRTGGIYQRLRELPAECEYEPLLSITNGSIILQYSRFVITSAHLSSVHALIKL
jgi:hypothetical protein